MKISHLIEVQKTEGASRGDEGVRAKADDTRAILELSFLHNQVRRLGVSATVCRFMSLAVMNVFFEQGWELP